MRSHLSEPEKEMLARAGARIVHNPTTNQYLGDGICDVVGLRSLGVPIGLGTDADIRPSLIDEMRSAALLAKLRTLDGAALGAQEAFAMGTSEGARALGWMPAIFWRADRRITSCSMLLRSTPGRRSATPWSIVAKTRGFKRPL